MTPQEFIIAVTTQLETTVLNKVNDKFPTNKIKTASSTGMNEAVTLLTNTVSNLLEELADSVLFNNITTDDLTEGATKKFLNTSNLNTLLAEGNTKTDNLMEGVTNLYYTQARTDARVNALRPTQATVTSPTGGVTIDAEARTAITSLTAALVAANILS